jgi:hypothetical protein
MFIPTSMAYLGAFFLILAVVLVYVDVPGKGVPWDKIGAWFAVIGGFGVGGAAAGWVGRGFASASDTVIAGGETVTDWAVGLAVTAAVAVGLVLWAYSRLRGEGIATTTKVKSLIVVGGLAVVGTVVAAVPGLYGLADRLVGWIGHGLIGAIQ